MVGFLGKQRNTKPYDQQINKQTNADKEMRSTSFFVCSTPFARRAATLFSAQHLCAHLFQQIYFETTIRMRFIVTNSVAYDRNLENVESRFNK